MRQPPRSLLAAAVVISLTWQAQGFSCSQPYFSCSPSMLSELSNTPQRLWHTLTGSPKTFGTVWLRSKAMCCSHCVWDLGYPLADPIAIATDRSSGTAGVHLDCSRFEVRLGRRCAHPLRPA